MRIPCSAYDEVRRKSGPKRGYVKELEARLGELIPIRSQAMGGCFEMELTAGQLRSRRC